MRIRSSRAIGGGGVGCRARRCRKPLWWRRGAEDFPTGSPGEGAPDRESEGEERGRERVRRERERERERERDQERGRATKREEGERERERERERKREREREREGGRERGLEPCWPPGGYVWMIARLAWEPILYIAHIHNKSTYLLIWVLWM